MERSGSVSRGLSPVIGVILMVAIAVVLSAAAATFILSLSQETDPQPDVALQLEETDGVTYRLLHKGGEDLVGNETRFLGVANPNALHGETLRAGDAVEVVPVSADVTLVWSGENTDHTLQRFEVDASTLPYTAANIDKECAWVESNINSNGDLDMSGDEAACSTTEETDTGISDIDIDIDSGSVLVGDISTDGDVDVDSSDVVGSITTNSDDITITDNSNIYADVVAKPNTNIDIDGNSNVTGAVVMEGAAGSGSLSIDSVDIDGHLYVDPGDLSCSDATIGPNDKSCSEYSPRDPSGY